MTQHVQWGSERDQGAYLNKLINGGFNKVENTKEPAKEQQPKKNPKKTIAQRAAAQQAAFARLMCTARANIPNSQAQEAQLADVSTAAFEYVAETYRLATALRKGTK